MKFRKKLRRLENLDIKDKEAQKIGEFRYIREDWRIQVYKIKKLRRLANLCILEKIGEFRYIREDWRIQVYQRRLENLVI